MKCKDIKIAILASEPLFWKSRKNLHMMILNDYQWKFENKKFRFSCSFIYDKDITQGKLNISNFDALIIPGGGVGNNQALMKGFNYLLRVRQYKNAIFNFIKNGGGCIGICGGAAFITDVKKDDGEKPLTFVERQYNKSSLGISCVSSYFKSIAFPIFYPFQYNHPEVIGNSAYAFSFSPGKTKDGKFIHSTGCTMDIKIFKNNPIFFDFNGNSIPMRWWAGQGLILPTKFDRDVRVLARYPSEEISEN
jgi:glutamine amidotransferase-like uncharacterized protein